MLERNLSWSAVGPDLGKWNSVRVIVCERGEEMRAELMDVEEGLVRFAAFGG